MVRALGIAFQVRDGASRASTPINSVTHQRRFALGVKPSYGALQALTKIDARPKTEFAVRPSCIELPARLAARLIRVPSHTTSKSNDICDEVYECADTNLVGGPQVNRLRVIVPLRC